MIGFPVSASNTPQALASESTFRDAKPWKAISVGDGCVVGGVNPFLYLESELGLEGCNCVRLVSSICQMVTNRCDLKIPFPVMPHLTL